MQLSTFAITISPPPADPQDLHRKFASTLGLLHPDFCQGWGFFGVGPEGRAFVYKRVLPFLEFSLLSQELATDNTLGFNICSSEILYVFKKIIQTSNIMSKILVEMQLFS